MSRTKDKAMQVLELPKGFEPVTRISQIMSNVGLDELVACLRSSTNEDSMIICAFYDRVPEAMRSQIDIDYLIAAAKCKVPSKVAGMICEAYCEAKAIQSQMIAATESPRVMRATARYGKERKGYQHAKLLLQTSGVAPVPSNQKNIFIGNRISQQNTAIIGTVPTHENVASEVDEVLAMLEPPVINVPSSDSRGEEESSGDEDEAED